VKGAFKGSLHFCHLYFLRLEIDTVPKAKADSTPPTSAAPDLNLELPNPEDENLSEHEFRYQIDTAWLVCDRFDLQTDIWRGRILRTIRDREKRSGDNRGTGFLNWLKDQEISKTQAYSLIELADSADTLVGTGQLEPATINRFSKRAFIETAQAAPEVQQMLTEAATNGEQITRREVRQLTEDWTATTSDLVPPVLREKVANNSIPTRYLAPLVKELEKLPEAHQTILQAELEENPDIDTLKQVTAEAKYLAKYLLSSAQTQALNDRSLNLEQALEEALRLGCVNTAADLVAQAAQLEQMVAKLYTTWKRVGGLVDRLYTDTGSSTPQLQKLLRCLEPLSGELLEVQIGEAGIHSNRSGLVRLQVLPEED
jgi:hypothetical protein